MLGMALNLSKVNLRAMSPLSNTLSIYILSITKEYKLALAFPRSLFP